ncbi:hypothetical protein P7K49_020680, partial [Saguinus oedipus]
MFVAPADGDVRRGGWAGFCLDTVEGGQQEMPRRPLPALPGHASEATEGPVTHFADCGDENTDAQKERTVYVLQRKDTHQSLEPRLTPNGKGLFAGEP